MEGAFALESARKPASSSGGAQSASPTTLYTDLSNVPWPRYAGPSDSSCAAVNMP